MSATSSGSHARLSRRQDPLLHSAPRQVPCGVDSAHVRAWTVSGSSRSSSLSCEGLAPLFNRLLQLLTLDQLHDRGAPALRVAGLVHTRVNTHSLGTLPLSRALVVCNAGEKPGELQGSGRWERLVSRS